MSHHVPGPPDYDVVMTEQVSGQNEPKMLGRHKPTTPYTFFDYDRTENYNLTISATTKIMKKGD